MAWLSQYNWCSSNAINLQITMGRKTHLSCLTFQSSATLGEAGKEQLTAEFSHSFLPMCSPAKVHSK